MNGNEHANLAVVEARTLAQQEVVKSIATTLEIVRDTLRNTAESVKLLQLAHSEMQRRQDDHSLIISGQGVEIDSIKQVRAEFRGMKALIIGMGGFITVIIAIAGVLISIFK